MPTDYEKLIDRLLKGVPEPSGDPKSRTIRVEAAEAISTLLKEREWQPIETAPKDKGAILGFMWIGDGAVTRVLHWDEDDGWHSDGHDYRPTHWMPLPPGP
jgi:hypothetical protein